MSEHVGVATTSSILHPIQLTQASSEEALLAAMLKIRGVEMALGDASLARKFDGPVHVSVGQEGAAVGIISALAPGDVLFSTHRGHGHALAFGLDPRAVVAEIVGSSAGIAGGRGGSMHIFSPAKGFLGTNGIVGDGAGLAVGAGLALRARGQSGVSVAVFGDGAMGTGIVYEAFNLAALWRLPVVFVCENNGYAEMTPTSMHLATDPLERARAFGLVTERADGLDVVGVRQAMLRTVALARNNKPAFVEVITSRWSGHFVGDQHQYRPADEEQTWRRSHCPIRHLGYAMGHDEEWVATREEDVRSAAVALIKELIDAA